MKRLYITLMLLMGIGWLFSQSVSMSRSNCTMIYGITDEEALAFITQKADIPDENWFYNLVDSCIINMDSLHLPQGHYLFVRALEEDLEITYRGFHAFSLLSFHDGKHLQLQVIDTLGKIIENAKVQMDGRTATYLPGRNAYQLPVIGHKKIARVQVGEIVAFFEVAPISSKSLCKRRFNYWAYNTGSGKVITYPYRVLRRFVFNSIRPERWRYIFRKKDYRGYVVISQPKYKPGDTLRVKAFLTTPHGRPLHRPMVLTLQQQYGGDILLDTIQPDLPGNYTMETALGDSLLIDKYYIVAFSNLRGGKKFHTEQSFYLEDYILDEATWDLSVNKQEYRKGEPVVITAEGKDANGINIPDGKVKLSLVTQTVNDFYEKRVLIPDTLWQLTQQLEPEGKTTIVLPDSIFPAARLSVKLVADFSNSAGELQTLHKSFEYLHVSTDTISNAKDHLVSCTGVHTKDSVFFHINNPRSLTVYYIIYKAGKEVAEGSTSSTVFDWQKPDDSDEAYLIRYQFPWQSGMETIQESAILYKNLLTIMTDQPDNVEPGDSVQVQVEVQDFESKPVPHVNLTAGAINAQFLSQGNFRSPAVPFRYPKGPFVKYNYNVQYLGHKSIKYTLNPVWYQRLHLKNNLYYSVRHPENGGQLLNIAAGKATFYEDKAQFAPYVTKEGRLQPIYMIYGNGELKYYYDTNDNPPYSFLGKEGYNKISIRTIDKEYTIDSVWLQKGHKTEITIDENQWQQSPLARYITVRETTPELTANERYIISQKILMLQNLPYGKSSYIWQEGTPIHIMSGSYNVTKIGPLRENRNFYYAVSGGFKRELLFEPGFIYEINQSRERLYQSALFTGNKALLNKKIIARNPGALIYTSDYIRLQPSLESLINYFNYEIPPTGTETGKLKIKVLRLKENLTALALMTKDSVRAVYRPYQNAWNSLPAGNHQLVLFAQDGATATIDIHINPDTMLCLELEDLLFKIDTTGLLLKKISGKIVSPNAFQTSYSFVDQNAYDMFDSGIQGIVVEEASGEAMIGAAVIFIKGGIRIGVATDLDGYFKCHLPPGEYDIEVNYIGMESLRMSAVAVNADTWTPVNLKMVAGALLQEVVVVRYSTPLIQMDNTTQGGTVTSYEFASMPTQNINSLLGKVAGVSTTEEGSLNIRGNRASGTEYYVDGIRVSADSINFDSKEDIGTGLRSNFKDLAYWKPALKTDRQGKATFSVTYPENITSWNTYMIGMNARRQAGVAYGKTKATKSLMAQLFMPRFLVEGDRSTAIGKLLNLTGDTLQVSASFLSGVRVLQQKDLRLTVAAIESTSISAGNDIDSLTISYVSETRDADKTYRDGEQKSIPVLKKGLEVSEGGFWVLENDTSFIFEPRTDWGEVTLIAHNNILEVLLEEIDNLKNYPYDCNEQIASRLIALLMEKNIRQSLNQSFRYDSNIRRMIKLLEKNQSPEGSWGWWQHGKPNHWMTTYVLKALGKADKAGFKSPALNKGMRLMANQLFDLDKPALLQALEVFSENNQLLDYQKFLAPLDTMPGVSLYQRLLSIKIKQQQKLPYSLDTLVRLFKKTTTGGIYLGTESYIFQGNIVQLTTLAYEICRTGNRTDLTTGLRHYLLENRSHQGWRNTFESAGILQVLLPDILQDGNQFPGSRLMINGTTVSFEKDIPLKNIYSGQEKISVQKTGNSPLYLGLYQQYWEKAPLPNKEIFDIQTTLSQHGKTVQDLELSTPATLSVQVVVKKSADFVKIEVPIPAGCDYYSKALSWNGVEDHREYFKDRTVIFCSSLPVGNYTFEIVLEPRFNGSYTMNPAKVEQLYFPVFYGNNEGKGVRVQESKSPRVQE
jgi:hypothetical protein